MEKLFKYLLDHEQEATKSDVINYSFIFPRWYKERFPTFNGHPWAELRYDPLDEWSRNKAKVGQGIVLIEGNRYYSLAYFGLYDHQKDSYYYWADTWNGPRLLDPYSCYRHYIFDMDLSDSDKVLELYLDGTKDDKQKLLGIYLDIPEDIYESWQYPNIKSAAN